MGVLNPVCAQQPVANADHRLGVYTLEMGVVGDSEAKTSATGSEFVYSWCPWFPRREPVQHLLQMPLTED